MSHKNVIAWLAVLQLSVCLFPDQGRAANELRPIPILPERPRIYVDTTYIPPSGEKLAVSKGGNFQAALNRAKPGDVIVLESGAVFTGPFTLPNKKGAGWIIIRSSAPDASLPPTGMRVDPSYAGAMPKLVAADNAVIKTEPGAHHYRFMGIEVTTTNTTTNTTTYNLIWLEAPDGQTSLSQVPNNIIFDRCYIHGTPTGNVRRGIAMNSAFTAVIDSYLSDFHEVGMDSQAIIGWNGPGPFKIVNNYLEGAGENVHFGGVDPSIPNLVPADIEVRNNHFFKPLSWRAGHPSYAGIHWAVKNIFELKNARRVLVDGNIFENNWLDAQNGFAILFTVRNQDGAAPWSVVEDVTFTNNIVRHTGSGMNILGRDDNYPSQQTKRILIKNNLFEDVDGRRWGGSGRLFQLLRGTKDVVIDHNTSFQTESILVADGEPHQGFIFRNNIVPHNEYGVYGNSKGIGLPSLTYYFPDFVFKGNVIVGSKAGSSYPSRNSFPASFDVVGFVDRARGDYRLANSSPYLKSGADGKRPGVDFDALSEAMGSKLSQPVRVNTRSIKEVLSD